MLGRLLAVSLSFFCASPLLFADSGIVWPTESTAFDKGAAAEAFIQPVAGKGLASGLFGAVRNNGHRFHEGIDIKPTRFTKKGEALDDVRAAFAGKVMFINALAGNSTYGRYVVLEHPDRDVCVYTLYAHLSAIDDSLKLGNLVKAGDRLGRMGRSAANYAIPKAASHLHFEVGLRYGDNFNSWYAAQKYKEKNFAGNFNGMNLMGMDPLAFMEAAKAGSLDKGFAQYILSQKTALVVSYYTKRTPDFVRRYPALTDLNGSKEGWNIYFTWFGLPQKMERIKDPNPAAKEGTIEILKYAPSQMEYKCRQLIIKETVKNKKGSATELIKGTPLLTETIEKMFMGS